ncbi:hypothetical protein BS47DRAFT_455835 [Hydnum rufescens UP504]|uniref:Uncharacterized protein n=1 Tax=Hydnum rufescens UP504 TaxID=1448309 RepID=A0A9P6DPC8_9AGAM|nr:hypothetical protein BS47DRAFT_455835 [Hydnum rufescens UP504]
MASLYTGLGLLGHALRNRTRSLTVSKRFRPVRIALCPFRFNTTLPYAIGGAVNYDSINEKKNRPILPVGINFVLLRISPTNLGGATKLLS